MITLDMFYMGRDKVYSAELNAELRVNAAETVRRVNLLLERFYAENPKAYKRGVNSGWRPAQVNSATRNAAAKSNHMICKACDISDDDEMLDNWLMSKSGKKALEEIGLWMESPQATPRWAHVQIVPPKSGRRVFMP